LRADGSALPGGRPPEGLEMTRRLCRLGPSFDLSDPTSEAAPYDSTTRYPHPQGEGAQEHPNVD